MSVDKIIITTIAVFAIIFIYWFFLSKMRKN